MMNMLMSQLRWSLALRGVLAVLFGLIAFFMPDIALATLILLFGVFVFLDGVIMLVAGIRYAREQQPRWWVLALEGVLGIVIGIVSWVIPEVTALSLLALVAAWAILTGALEIVVAIRLREEIENEWLLGLSGVLSIVLGVLFILIPGAGLLAWVWMIGAYSLLTGGLLLTLAYRRRHYQTRSQGVRTRTVG